MVMNSGTSILAVYEPLPQWVNFLAIFFAVALAAIGVLLWAVVFRKKRRRKHHHKHRTHHESRNPNPTLAETGGLPPLRPSEKPSDQPPL
jgi:cytochrome c-type biogenesis protein CcmH/NrfF